MSQQPLPPQPQEGVRRGTLIRDVALLQVKLIVDGVRDFVLVPVSLVAGFVSFVSAGESSGRQFYDLLRFGKKSERWINLFGAVDNVPAPPDKRDACGDEDIDSLVSRLEAFVIAEHRRGGVTRQAKEHLDQLLNGLRGRRARGPARRP